MISNADFVHLHCHSEYSRFDGLAKIDSFVLTAKLMGFPALGLTDHGNVGGWIKFWQACKKKKFSIDSLTDRSLLQTTKVKYKITTDKKTGAEKEIELEDSIPLKPILGEEFYLARQHELLDASGNPIKQVDGRKGNRHILLLAKDEDGYKNICTLSQRSWTHGQYIDPRIDLNLLAEHSKGVICSSACLGSVVNNNLLHGRFEQARRVAGKLKEIYGEDFYLSTMYHGIEAEAAIIADQVRLSEQLGVPLIAENDCHCCTKNQVQSQELLMAMSTSRCIKDPKRIHFPYPEFYMKSAAEMHKIYGSHPKILTNTRMIAERIGEAVKTSTMRLPKFDVGVARESAVILKGEGVHEKGKKFLDEILERHVTVSSAGEVESSDGIFEKAYAFMGELVAAGMAKLGWDGNETYVKQLKTEMSDVRVAWESNRMDFATYFLIVWDYINFARSKKILTGCGRGSGYASVILRCLGITYGPFPKGMIWERFLGFDQKHYLNDKDWGFDEAVTEEQLVLVSDENEDILEDRLVEDDQGGVDRY